MCGESWLLGVSQVRVLCRGGSHEPETALKLVLVLARNVNAYTALLRIGSELVTARTSL